MHANLVLQIVLCAINIHDIHESKGKVSHDDGVVIIFNGETSCGHVRVADSLDLFNGKDVRERINLLYSLSRVPTTVTVGFVSNRSWMPVIFENDRDVVKWLGNGIPST